VDAGFTQVAFAKPAASTFDFTPPKGAKVTEGKDSKDSKDTKAPESAPTRGDLGKGLDGLKTVGKGWSTIAEFDTGGQGMPSGSSSEGGNVSGFLNSLGDHVKGKFGSGTVFSTRLVNALITDDGKVYAGAVTKDALVKAANAAH
jgi:hypothetical protein